MSAPLSLPKVRTIAWSGSPGVLPPRSSSPSWPIMAHSGTRRTRIPCCVSWWSGVPCVRVCVCVCCVCCVCLLLSFVSCLFAFSGAQRLHSASTGNRANSPPCLCPGPLSLKPPPCRARTRLRLSLSESWCLLHARARLAGTYLSRHLSFLTSYKSSPAAGTSHPLLRTNRHIDFSETTCSLPFLPGYKTSSSVTHQPLPNHPQRPETFFFLSRQHSNPTRHDENQSTSCNKGTCTTTSCLSPRDHFDFQAKSQHLQTQPPLCPSASLSRASQSACGSSLASSARLPTGDLSELYVNVLFLLLLADCKHANTHVLVQSAPFNFVHESSALPGISEDE